MPSRLAVGALAAALSLAPATRCAAQALAPPYRPWPAWPASGGLAVGAFDPYTGWGYYGAADYYGSGWYGGTIYGGGLIAGYAPPLGPAYYGAGAYLPPVVLPAETLYGPTAVQRFMGVDTGWGDSTAPALPAAGAVVSGHRAAAATAPPDVRPRASNAQAKARAQQFLNFGDAYFGKQKYHEAYQRYKDASVAAPDLPEAYFRQGWAMIAMGQVEAAAKALRRGLQLHADWPNSGFQLETLYQGQPLAKANHREMLAKAAIDEPANPDPLLLLGAHFYFDGQPQRAAEFFQRAQRLEPLEFSAEKAFLDALAKAAPPKPQPKDIEL